MTSVPPLIHMSKVSIIIFNWNGWKDMLECLQSVQQINYPNFRVLVVDNGSSDESVVQLQQAFPDVDLLETGENLGYAGGNNAGIVHAMKEPVEFILLLNNDTIVDPEILTAFVDAASRYPRASILGEEGKTCYSAKPDPIWALGGGNWDKRCGFPHWAQDQPDDSSTTTEAFELDYVIGCVLFCRTDMIRDIGVMEEAYFLNFEEMDWCYWAREKHKVSSSFGGANSPLIGYFMVRNKLLWEKKYLPQLAKISLHKGNLRTIRRILLPPLSLAKTSLPLVKNCFGHFPVGKNPEVEPVQSNEPGYADGPA